jgi:hypothetical protein
MKVIDSNAHFLFLHIKQDISEENDLMFCFPDNVIYMNQLLVVMVAFGARVNNTTEQFNKVIEACYADSSA